jgi:hypothetical protein
MWVITQELQRNNTESRKYSVPGKCFWSYCFQQRLLGPHAIYRNVHFQSDSAILVALCTNVTPNAAGTRISLWTWFVKVKVISQEAKVAQGVPGRFKAPDFLDVRHYKGGRSSSIRTGRLYPSRNPWYSLSEAESTSGYMVPSVGAMETTGNRSRTDRLAARCFNHYATPGPGHNLYFIYCRMSWNLLTGRQVPPLPSRPPSLRRHHTWVYITASAPPDSPCSPVASTAGKTFLLHRHQTIYQ